MHNEMVRRDVDALNFTLTFRDRFAQTFETQPAAVVHGVFCLLGQHSQDRLLEVRDRDRGHVGNPASQNNGVLSLSGEPPSSARVGGTTRADIFRGRGQHISNVRICPFLRHSRS